MTSLPNIDIIASYRNSKNEIIAPFIIEKNFSSGGKIILLNSKGYFDSISKSKSPTKYFLTLPNISQLLPVDLGKGTISQNTSLPSKAFIGKMQIYGKVSLNSSSLSLPYEDNNPYLLNTSRIAVFNGTDTPIVLNNVSINGLKIMGDYAANIDMTGPLELPDMRTNHDYIDMQIPAGFNLTVRLPPEALSHMEIVTQNQSIIKSFHISNDTRVVFYGIKPASLVGEPVPVLLKRPEMKVDGHITIKNTYFGGFLNARGGLNMGVPLDLLGHLETKFDLADKFDKPYRNTTRTTYITYLQTLSMDGSFKEDKDRLNLPGDIYFKAKETGHGVPLKQVLTSSTNIIALIVLISMIIIASKFFWRKKKL
jgi:hypothetical protein